MGAPGREAVRTVVYASYVSPYPANSGERIRALNLIAALRVLGYRVEAFVGNYDGVDLAAHNAPGLRFHQIPFAWPRLRQAVGTYFRPNADFVRQIAGLNAAEPLSAVILDYGFMGAQIAALARLGIAVVLGTHNFESALTGQVPTPSPGARLAIGLRQAVEAAHERRFFARADAVICVSEEDRREYAKFIAPDRLHVVPNFIDIPDSFGPVARQDRIIMSGSFDNFQNRSGLAWFVRQVWDDDLRALGELCVAGKHSAEAAAEFAAVPGVTGLGPRADLLREIAGSRCAIVPLHQGGGTRFKCLEAMAVRTPVVTTSKGCEGIAHGGTFWVADTPVSFKAAILQVHADREGAARRAAEGRAIFDRLYSLDANAARLDAVLARAAQVRDRRALALSAAS